MGLEPAADGEDGPLQFGVGSVEGPGGGPASGRRGPSGPACTPAAKLGIPREYPMGVKGNAEES